MRSIIIQGGEENNLKNVTVEIPHNTLTVVTGVSGSGKSSLVYDIIYREGQRRYLESFSGYSRQYFGKLKQPAIQSISGIKPAISIDQKTVIRNVRSTVGTLSGLYDYLRLLFARLAVCKDPKVTLKPERRLFSFNSAYGACTICKGLGIEEKIDPAKLISDPNLSLSQGALVITAPNGYIIYSQVTMEVLNTVLNAHSFNVDIPWNELTEEQKKIVLYGSEIIKIPFGKHTLESRMKWAGITAKPREEGYYRGIIPIMEEILKRDRNENILRFVSSVTCSECNGKKLRKEALSFYFHNKNIDEIAYFTIDECIDFFNSIQFEKHEIEVGEAIKNAILKPAKIIQKLGAGYLTIARESVSLSSGEAQRIRLASQVGCGLRNIMYILDEPSVGLHPQDNQKLMEVLNELLAQENTVIIVEHDEATIAHAEYLIDIGPAAGLQGGEILFSGYTNKLNKKSTEGNKSITFDYLYGRKNIEIPSVRRFGKGKIILNNLNRNNLKNISIHFKSNVFNVITGVSGAGKSTLAEELIIHYKEKKLSETVTIDKIIEVNQSPIGRSPKSNPATYTGLSDHIRDLFASLPEAKTNKFGKSTFSFNIKGGQCETCQGAGVISVGMHFMGNVDVVCETCQGKRFNDATLQIKYKNKSIFEVLELTIYDALNFFNDQPKIMRYINALYDTGLGYITLGQPSTTLSGGEAQRIKLATELAKPSGKHTLYILDEPSTGLHTADIKILLKALNGLIEKGHTVVIIEHNMHFIKCADHVIDLGPESGINGGSVVFSGTPEMLTECEFSHTGKELKKIIDGQKFNFINHKTSFENKTNSITFKGVETHNLKKINIEIPTNKITVFTGLSGSGKSSLLMDTVYAECKQRFAESFPAYIRTQISKPEKPDFDDCSGLMPAIAIDQGITNHNPRSTVGTATEIYDYYRLLYARIGKKLNSENINSEEKNLSSLFSFNHESGACEYCKGLGFITVCDEDKLISFPKKSILSGAMNDTKTGKFYGDIYGQYIWTIRKVGELHNIDYNVPWNELNEQARQFAMQGTGNIEYDVIWKHKRKNVEGEHNFKTIWKGLAYHVNEEYARKHNDDRGKGMLDVMKHDTCPICKGSRLNSTALKFHFAEMNIAKLCEKTIDQSIKLFQEIDTDFEKYKLSKNEFLITKNLRYEILRRLQFLADAGIGYLSPARSVSSLSGGEVRRTKLACQLNSGLTGVLYILDEPTIGLHQKDTNKLIQVFQELKKLGNTIAIIEHDEDIILCADHVIEIGPGAGKNGGEIIACESPTKLLKNQHSLTGKYLRKFSEEKYSAGAQEKKIIHKIIIQDAYANNLKHINLEIPIGVFTVITGVSGSGKTSLVFDVLHQSMIIHKPVFCKSISCLEHFDSVIAADQESISTTSTSNAATLCGFFDEIRNLFANTDFAKINKFDKSFFSFNNSGGRCENCQGKGKVKVSMDFLSDIWSLCEECNGSRFKKEILDCVYQNFNISEILGLSIDESLSVFSGNKKIEPALNILKDCGLGYIQIGQTTDTFSGGESQRIKLARELISSKGKQNLYLFDEPTTGLHFQDIDNLFILFKKLTDAGHTIVAIEHNRQLIQYSDCRINLGPGAGNDGGEITQEQN